MPPAPESSNVLAVASNPARSPAHPRAGPARPAMRRGRPSCGATGNTEGMATTPPVFHSPYSHGFVRAAAAVPEVRVGDPEFNGRRTVALARRAHELHAGLVIFPELGIAAYSSEDLFHQGALLDGVTGALERIVAASAELAPVIVVGAPVTAEGGLFNAAVVVHRGRILGAVPKSYIPEYREYYEKRQFRAARDLVGDHVRLLGAAVPFGADLVFACRDVPAFALGVEICEDVWTAVPPSTYLALAGATVLA